MSSMHAPSILALRPLLVVALFLLPVTTALGDVAPDPNVRMSTPIPDEPPDQSEAFAVWVENFKSEARAKGIPRKAAFDSGLSMRPFAGFG